VGITEERALSMDERLINLNVELNETEAMAFAQFLKRVGYEDFKTFSVSSEEAYLMQSAGESIRKALALKNISPR
jgi:hypothetical protein